MAIWWVNTRELAIMAPLCCHAGMQRTAFVVDHLSPVLGIFYFQVNLGLFANARSFHLQFGCRQVRRNPGFVVCRSKR